jgi:hypothetical protein
VLDCWLRRLETFFDGRRFYHVDEPEGGSRRARDGTP